MTSKAIIVVDSLEYAYAILSEEPTNIVAMVVHGMSKPFEGRKGEGTGNYRVLVLNQ